MARKIIQISAYTNSLGEGVFALCDDGTLWRLSPMFGWESVNKIPQDENEDNE